MPVTAAEYGGTLPSAVETPPSLFACVDAQIVRGKQMSAAASHWYFSAFGRKAADRIFGEAIYHKGAKDDLTPAEKKALRKLNQDW